MLTDKAEFEVVGTIERINGARSGKVSWLRIRVRGQVANDVSHDIKVFQALPGFAVGDGVRVTGRLGREKIEGAKEIGKNGREYDKWATMLVGERVVELEPGQGEIPATKGGPPPGDDIPF